MSGENDKHAQYAPLGASEGLTEGVNLCLHTSTPEFPYVDIFK